MITKIKITYIAIVFLLGGAISAFAESHMDQMGSEMGMQNSNPDCKMHASGMMHTNKGMAEMMPMDGCLMGRQVVPTEDGGIVLIIGPHILKYDAELNLVKKTVIDLGPEDMKEMMYRHKQMREMMKEASGDSKKGEKK